MSDVAISLTVAANVGHLVYLARLFFFSSPVLCRAFLSLLSVIISVPSLIKDLLFLVTADKEMTLDSKCSSHPLVEANVFEVYDARNFQKRNQG